MVLLAFMALFCLQSIGLSQWHADYLPDYKSDVLDWWESHPFNPEGPNFDMSITHPVATVNLTSGGSIQTAINNAGSSGVTIYLATGSYSNFSIIGKSNIHIIAPNGATITGGGKYIAACNEAIDYHNFNACFHNRTPACVNCFRNPIKNIYVEGITFNGGGNQRDSHVMKVVRGVVFKDCTWQNFSYVGEHHPGVISGHERIENVWFIGCHFVGTQYNGFYLDGAHATGCIFSEFESGCSHGMLFLTNDDFSEDFSEDGHWDYNEKRNAQYIVVVGNTFDNVGGNCIDINQGGHILIKDNIQIGDCDNFIYSTDRCSQRYHDLFYEGLYNRVLDNQVASCGNFYEVNSRQFNCPEFSECRNYGKLGRFVVKGNEVATCTNFVNAYGALIYDPTFVTGNRYNGSGTAEINFTTDAPVVAISSHTNGQDVPVATEVVIAASITDADGVSSVTFRVNDDIIGVDNTAPYEISWMPGDVILGTHEIQVEAMDIYGRKGFAFIDLDVVDTDQTDTATITGMPFNVTTPVGTTVTKTFTIDLDGAATANLYFKAFDIDDSTEAKMYLNGTERALPCYTIAPDGPHDDSMEVPISWLVDGINTVIFEFANNPEGTTRYEVQNFVIGVSYSGTRTAMPAMEPVGGSFECYTDITIATSTPDANIWFTTDGSEPAENQAGSTLYTSPIHIASTATVKAKAFAEGLDPSFTKTEVYQIITSRNPDIDGDSDVDFDDLAQLVDQWLFTDSGLEADFTCDDSVDFVDFAVLTDNWQPPVTGTFMQDSGAQGIVSIEAENYNTKAAGTSDPVWEFVNTPTGYSGTGAMSALPNTGVNNDSGYVVSSPVMNYDIGFVKTGTHYVWILGGGDSGSDDSVHLGLDGTALSTGYNFNINEEVGNWGWNNKLASNALATFNIPATGVYTFNIWMREDGVRVDKIVITTDSAYTPSGTGPAESPRQE